MKTATPKIPPGYHSITPPLTVRAAAAAIDFYRRAFGAAELMRMPGPDTGARGE
jgi:PhnB protein